jgi:probable ATP-dependent RNA helicase DDX4
MPNTETRQTLLFSATFPEQIQSFAAKFLRKEYLFIKVGVVGGACSDVTQRLVQVQSAEATKSQVLEDIVKAVDNNQRTLVFVETKRKADFIACMLSQTQIPTTSIHGGR